MNLITVAQSALRRLGDLGGTVWSLTEAEGHVQRGYDDLGTQFRVFWDQVYLENLPRGFSHTETWEQVYIDRNPGLFDYGQANYTMDDERGMFGTDRDERTQVGPANHTSPFEATDGLLSDAGASTAISATTDVPKTLTAIERVTWDDQTTEALRPRTQSRLDSRYELTKGEVYGFMWQKDGIRTLRKVRVPAESCATYTITGGFGILRKPTDISGDTVTGTWGVPRRIPGMHPIGTESFGFPRRPYQETRNVRVEHYRRGRVLDNHVDECELPTRYALYLRDYACWQLLNRKGPGQDVQLAAHFKARWDRGITRLQSRITRMNRERAGVLGDRNRLGVAPPPTPSLPWNYGQVVRMR